MASISERENKEIEAANASGATAVGPARADSPAWLPGFGLSVFSTEAGAPM